jgi:CDP-paratose 2-epimerase
LRYLGFGGTGKQVRDLVHVDDVVDLVSEQLAEPERWHGATVNAGGGRDVSLSLREATALCAEISGNTVDVVEDGSDRPGDIPMYISDCSRLAEISDWRPRRSASDVLQDTCEWIAANETAVKAALR